MAIYTYQCPKCGHTREIIFKDVNTIVFCENCSVFYMEDEDLVYNKTRMNLIPSVPSPMQWGCRKGF